MAEFGPKATELAAPQGAGANPTQGVVTSSYTPDLSGLAGLVKGGMDIFDNMKKDKAEEAKKNTLSNISSELGEAEQEFQQTQDANRYAVRKSTILRKYQTSNPDLLNEIKTMAGLSKEGVGGIAEDEDAANRKREQKMLTDAADQGFVIPKDPAARRSVIDALQTTRRIGNETEEYRKAVIFQGQADEATRKKMEADMKEQAIQGLVTISGKHSLAFNDAMFDLAKQVQGGGLSPEEAMNKAQGHYQLISGQINAMAARDPAAAAPFREQFNQIFSSYKDSFVKGADVTALENKWKTMKLNAQIQVGGDAELLRLSVLSDMFRNQPQIFTSADKIVTKTLIKWGAAENGRLTPKEGEGQTQIVGDSKLEKQTYSAIKGGIKSYLDGADKPEVKKGMRSEVFGQMKGVVSQYVDQYQLRKLTPEARKNMSEFLIDKGTARFLKENPLPVDLARGLVQVADDNFKQYERTVIENMPESLRGPDSRSAVQKMGGRGMGGQSNKAVRGEDVSPLDAIDIRWERDSLVFTPRKMPVDQIDQNKAVRDLNAVAAALSNGVRIGAHIEGRDDYGAYFESVKHRLFPGKFEAPPIANDKTQQKLEFSSEEKMRSSGAATLTPSEQANETRFETSPGNLEELERQIAKETNPENIRLLLEERDKLVRMRNAR